MKRGVETLRLDSHEIEEYDESDSKKSIGRT